MVLEREREGLCVDLAFGWDLANPQEKTRIRISAFFERVAGMCWQRSRPEESILLHINL